MSISEIIILTLVLMVIAGQLWLVGGARRRLNKQMREAELQAAKKKAQLIDDEFDKNLRNK